MFISSLSNRNLIGIQGEKCICESFGVKEGDCEVQVESKTKETYSEKSDLPPAV